MENPREVKKEMMLKVHLAVNCDKLIDLILHLHLIGGSK